MKRTIYRLGENVTTFKCPLKSMSNTFVQHAVELYQFFENGITPNKTLEAETALYRETMSLLTIFKNEALDWFQKEEQQRLKKKRGQS